MEREHELVEAIRSGNEERTVEALHRILKAGARLDEASSAAFAVYVESRGCLPRAAVEVLVRNFAQLAPWVPLTRAWAVLAKHERARLLELLPAWHGAVPQQELLALLEEGRKDSHRWLACLAALSAWRLGAISEDIAVAEIAAHVIVARSEGQTISGELDEALAPEERTALNQEMASRDAAPVGMPAVDVEKLMGLFRRRQ